MFKTSIDTRTVTRLVIAASSAAAVACLFSLATPLDARAAAMATCTVTAKAAPVIQAPPYAYVSGLGAGQCSGAEGILTVVLNDNGRRVASASCRTSRNRTCTAQTRSVQKLSGHRYTVNVQLVPVL